MFKADQVYVVGRFFPGPGNLMDAIGTLQKWTARFYCKAPRTLESLSPKAALISFWVGRDSTRRGEGFYWTGHRIQGALENGTTVLSGRV